MKRFRSQNFMCTLRKLEIFHFRKEKKIRRVELPPGWIRWLRNITTSGISPAACRKAGAEKRREGKQKKEKRKGKGEAMEVNIES